jgi:hypothetical protein
LSVVGNAREWIELLEQMLPELLKLAVETWQSIAKPFTSTREDDITRVLCSALRRNRSVRELPFYVQLQMVAVDDAVGEELGRMDIAFLPTSLSASPNESIYFCLECKRLNVIINGRRRPGGTDYVLHGMMRFVTGQYANAVPHGGMLGYVIDGKLAAALKNVQTNVRKRHQSLGMQPPGTLRQSTILAGLATARESDHERSIGPSPFRLHHIFVDALGTSV